MALRRLSDYGSPPHLSETQLYAVKNRQGATSFAATIYLELPKWSVLNFTDQVSSRKLGVLLRRRLNNAWTGAAVVRC